MEQYENAYNLKMLTTWVATMIILPYSKICESNKSTTQIDEDEVIVTHFFFF